MVTACGDDGEEKSSGMQSEPCLGLGGISHGAVNEAVMFKSQEKETDREATQVNTIGRKRKEGL